MKSVRDDIPVGTRIVTTRPLGPEYPEPGVKGVVIERREESFGLGLYTYWVSIDGDRWLVKEDAIEIDGSENIQ